MSEYLLVKRGLYYAPNRQGYTGVKARAGRYTQAEGEALADCGVTTVHQDEAPMFSPACWNEVKVEYLLGRIAAGEKALRDVLDTGFAYRNTAAFVRAREHLGVPA